MSGGWIQRVTIGCASRRVCRRLHRDQRGGIGVLMVLTAFVLVALIGMVWNTGEITTRKMRAQAVADAAAYSAAQWNARAVNLITASNIVILRTASAQTLALASAETIALVTPRLLRLSDLAVKLMADPLTFPIGAALAAKLATEWAALIRFARQVMPAIRKIPSMRRRLKALYKFQVAVVAQTPRWIEQQRHRLERDSGHRLYLTQAGARKPGTVRPPLRRGSALSMETVLVAQVNRDRRRLGRMLRPIVLGRAYRIWMAMTTGTSAVIAATTDHHVLVTQRAISELPPTETQRNTAFSVLAVAASGWSTRPKPFIRSQVGARVKDVVAYAAAETFNGNENTATGLIGAALPWRVWSKHGWFWRPRLTRAEALRLAIRDGRDRKLSAMFNRAGIRFYGRGHDISPVNLH